MATIQEKLAATVGKFPAPPLMCVVAELKREAKMREHVYPRLIDSGKLTEEQALYQQRCLEEAIDIIEGKVPAVDPGRVSQTPEPGEPYYTLLGRDLGAGNVLRSWAWLMRKQIREKVRPPTDDPKVTSIMRTADAMDAFRPKHLARKVAAPKPVDVEPEAIPEAS